MKQDAVIPYLIWANRIVGLRTLALRSKYPLSSGKYGEFYENWKILQE